MRLFLIFAMTCVSFVFITNGAFAQFQDMHIELENILLNPDADTPYIYDASLHEDEDVQGHQQSTGGLPQLDSTTFASQLFWLAITFFTLFFLLSTRYLPRVAGGLEDRRSHIQTNLDDANALKTEAAHVQSHYDEVIKNAYESSAALMQEANDDLKTKTEVMTSDFRTRSTQAIHDTAEDIDAMKSSLMKDIEDIAATVTAKTVEKMTGAKADTKTIQTTVQTLNKKAA